MIQQSITIILTFFILSLKLTRQFLFFGLRMMVGPNSAWNVEKFLKQEVLQDLIFDGTPAAGKDVSQS